MKLKMCSNSGLQYNSFTVIFMQTFVSMNVKEVEGDVISDFIDREIFAKFNDNLVKRYELPDFNIKIDLSPEGNYLNSIKGIVKVQAAVYFNNAVSISYRFVVNDKSGSFCKSENPFTADDLILLSGLLQGVEHWEKKGDEYTINSESFKISISDLKIPNYGETVLDGKENFVKLLSLYKSMLVDETENDECCKDSYYSFVDVWENVGHLGGFDFSKLSEAGIIEHIRNEHKPELIGIMSSYPFEWPFRSATDFNNICGDNIAIDTDDLVLVNENMTLIFGTYGLRGTNAKTDWKEHLESRAIYHTSWMEYFILVEMAIIKKVVMTYVLMRYNENIDKISSPDRNKKGSYTDLKEVIYNNAILNIKLISIISKLDVARYLRYMSHKHMYRKTCENLAIEEDLRQLEYITENSDLALNNANNIRELKQSNQTNLVLGIISIASLLEIVLSEAQIPLFDEFEFGVLSTTAGRLVVFFTILLIIWTTVSYLRYHTNIRRK